MAWWFSPFHYFKLWILNLSIASISLGSAIWFAKPTFVLLYFSRPWQWIQRATTVFVSGGCDSWSCEGGGRSTQRHVVTSEYHRRANTAAELLCIQSILTERFLSVHPTGHIYCNNLSTVALTHIPALHTRTKHTKLDVFFVRVMVSHIPSLYQRDIYEGSMSPSVHHTYNTNSIWFTNFHLLSHLESAGAVIVWLVLDYYDGCTVSILIT